MKRTWLGSNLLAPTLMAAALLVGAGCSSATKAFPAASLRSGCNAGKIKVVQQDGSSVTLDVCGVHEDWKFHAWNGWEYVGASANQPLPPQPVDADADGVLTDVDACPYVAGIASLDATTNGCPPPPDGDRDGIADHLDRCPGEIGVSQEDPAKNGCAPDADGDSIADSKDACADKAGVANDDASKNGCPADGDGDGVIDAEDACKDVAGVADADAAKNGCPADTDADGIADSLDACVDEAGEANEDAAKNGCPAAPLPKKGGKAPPPKAN
jgi:hypothetical protein